MTSFTNIKTFTRALFPKLVLQALIVQFILLNDAGNLVKAASSTTVQPYAPYCNLYQPTVTPATTPLALGNSQQTQSDCVAFDSYQIQAGDAGMNMMIELKFDAPENKTSFFPAFAYRYGANPDLYYDTSLNLRFNCTGYDSNGYNNQKSYMYIRILSAKDTNFTVGNTLHFSVYLVNGSPYSTTYNYNISITTYSNIPCPNGCSDNGVCNTATGVCTCFSNYIDEDCSQMSTPIFFNTQINTTVAAGKWDYFITLGLDTTSDLQIEFEKTGGDANVFVKLQYDSSVIKLPNNNDKYGGKTMDGSNHYQVIPLFSSDLTGTKGCISIGVQNTGSTSVQMFILISSQDTGIASLSIIVYVLIGMAALSTLICIVSSIMKYREQRLLQRTREAHRQALAAQKLTSEEIDKYIPKKKYVDCTSKFDVACSVCLEDFEDASEVRQISICEHIFHEKCVETWVDRHQNCPNCKQDLKREEFDKFLADPEAYKAKKNESTKSPDTQLPPRRLLSNESPERHQIPIDEESKEREEGTRIISPQLMGTNRILSESPQQRRNIYAEGEVEGNNRLVDDIERELFSVGPNFRPDPGHRRPPTETDPINMRSGR